MDILDIRFLLDQERGTLERYCKSHALYGYIRENEAFCRVLGKYLMYVNPSDYSVAIHLITSGFWEIWITQALNRLPKWAKCADVGANAGYYTMVLADLCEEVFAFEPQVDLARKIEKSVAVNGFRDRVTVTNAAVGEKAGLCRLNVSQVGNLGGVSVSEAEELVVRGLDDIPVVSLDEAVPGRLDFIKVDVEGYEPQVWAGMQRHLESRPTILLEFSAGSYADAKGFLAEICSCYSLREVNNDGRIVPVDAEVILGRKDFSMLWLEA